MNASCQLIITFSIHLIALQLEEQRIHFLPDLTMMLMIDDNEYDDNDYDDHSVRQHHHHHHHYNSILVLDRLLVSYVLLLYLSRHLLGTRQLHLHLFYCDATLLVLALHRSSSSVDTSMHL